MVMAVGHYVSAQKLAFPYAEGLISGPFEESADAWEEMRRIRATKLYADCNLRVKTHRARSLPVKTPRRMRPAEPVPEFNLRLVGERRRAAEALAAHGRSLGAEATIEDWDGEPDVDFRTPTLQATIWLAWTPQAPMPIVSWHSATHWLRPVPGAWRAGDINTSHGRKATSLCDNWPAVFEALTAGILASIDGSAFDLQNEREWELYT